MSAALAEPVEPGQYVMIAVTDTGVGMDQPTLERAFEPFFTTKDVGKGTGLGLSQVYGFVRQSAGHVRIYSELGEGTTVKIYLPRHVGDEDAARGRRNRRRQPRARSAPRRILVVEDDDALRAYTVEILTRARLSRAGRRRTAPPRCEMLDSAADVDLLFTDVVMPGGMNGRQLADEAVRRRPGLKVLFTTGYTRNAIVHHGRLDPGVHMIGKPFSSTSSARRCGRCWTAELRGSMLPGADRKANGPWRRPRRAMILIHTVDHSRTSRAAPDSECPTGRRPRAPRARLRRGLLLERRREPGQVDMRAPVSSSPLPARPQRSSARRIRLRAVS